MDGTFYTSIYITIIKYKLKHMKALLKLILILSVGITASCSSSDNDDEFMPMKIKVENQIYARTYTDYLVYEFSIVNNSKVYVGDVWNIHIDVSTGSTMNDHVMDGMISPDIIVIVFTTEIVEKYNTLYDGAKGYYIRYKAIIEEYLPTGFAYTVMDKNGNEIEELLKLSYNSSTKVLTLTEPRENIARYFDEKP